MLIDLHEQATEHALTLAAKARRFTSPDEHPFTPLDKLPKPAIAAQTFPTLLHTPASTHPSVNVNSRILDFYVNHIVPGITEVAPGSPRVRTTGASLSVDDAAAALDDGNYGSAATRDVEVLQALSRRIHFGEWSARVALEYSLVVDGADMDAAVCSHIGAASCFLV